MSLLAIKKLEDCFGASRIYEYRLGCGVSDSFLDRLAALGELTCKRNLKRPFFVLKLPDGAQVKGVLGDTIVKASFPEQSGEGCRLALEAALTALVGAEMEKEAEDAR